MIIVEARLDRTVYLAGEVLECFVSFTNQTPEGAVPLNSSDSESLAWASAQLHCQCSVSEARVVWPGEDTGEVPHGQEGSDTVFIPSRGERGHTVLSTSPRILFCDLKLHKGETKTYLYREVIPREAPPSYRGHSVKYSYKVTIGTQRVGAPTKLLRVPFRVLVVYDLGDPTVYEEVPPSNPFLEEQRQEGSLLELAGQVLTTITGRKSPNVYNITNQRGTVGKFTLFKSAYRIGEDIVGSFDYAGASVPCMQFTVTLQSEEHIAEECRRKPSQAVATMSFSRHHEFCLHTQRGHMILPIPLSATPSFMTDIVTVKWRLHFEFVLACSPISQPELPTSQSESTTWQGPSSVAVDTMVWDLPIKVLPTNPLQATAVSLIKSSSSIKV
ncbi:RAB6A-GEF complex partner protein 2-like isoform X1 [Branchiostoma floridae]|uniref:RAB6A-GEF complex partner protein 2-like isoform X1 n=1 Tax=Branchiostoma floridae TaxID=7739 RepID=A0A9J7KMH1_BRAFL|nr:RAB6A-GEF complex partner protein 2-like isoform X1 [Branchiostoma floridae]